MGKSTLTLEMLIGAKMSPEYNRTLNKATQSLTKMTGSMARMARRINVGFWATQGVRAVKDMAEVYGEFEQAMANTASVANATSLEYDKMWNSARAAGRSTTMTATESAEALGYMALAGWDVNTSTRALMPVLKLAEATGADLQTTSDLVTDSMGAMGLSIDELDAYLDKLVATNNNANTTSEMLMQALIRTGGAATTLGADLDDVITAIGVLGSSGIKSEKAGTALNAIFTRIGTNKNAMERLQALGVDIFDNGKFIGLEETLKAINAAMDDLRLPDEERIAALKDIAGTHHASKFAYLMNAVSDGSDKAASSWDKLEREVTGSEGALERMNERATSTLPAAIERFNSAVNDSKIAVTDVFGDDLRLFIDDIALKIPTATDAIAGFVQENRRPLLEIVEGLEDFAAGAGGKILDIMEFLVNNQGLVMGLGTSVMSLKVLPGIVSGISPVISVISKMGAGGFLASVAAAIGPAGWITAGLATAAGAIAGIYFGTKQWNAELRDRSLEEHFGDIVLSMSEIEDIADRIVGMGSIDAMTRELDELSAISGSIDDAIDSLDRLDWKVRIGVSLDSEEQRDYQSSIDSFVRGMNDYVSQKGYSSAISLNILYGSKNERGNALKEKLNAYYSNAGMQMSKLGTSLADYVNKAFSDGILSEKEEKKIRKKMERLQKLQAEIQAEQDAAKMDVLASNYSGSRISAESYRELMGQLSETQVERDEHIDESTASLIANGALSDMEKQDILNTGLFNKAVSAANTTNTGLGIFMQGYSDELEKGAAQLERKYSEIIEDYMGRNADFSKGWMSGMSFEFGGLVPEVSEADRKAFQDIYDQLLPQKEELEAKAQQLAELGMEIPKEISNALQNIDFVGIMSGRGGVMWDAIASTIVNDPDKQKAYDEAVKSGEDIPDELGKAMANAASGSSINGGVSQIYNTVRSAINSKFASPITTTATIEVKYTTPSKNPSFTTTATGGAYNANGTPKSNALGGIYNSPILTTFAEEGPEAAIPLDGSARAKGLWLRAGARLGMTSKLSGLSRSLGDGAQAPNNTSITFSPSVTIQGNADETDVNRGIQASYESFRQMMRQYQRETNRVSYARN